MKFFDKYNKYEFQSLVEDFNAALTVEYSNELLAENVDIKKVVGKANYRPMTSSEFNKTIDDINVKLRELSKDGNIDRSEVEKFKQFSRSAEGLKKTYSAAERSSNGIVKRFITLGMTGSVMISVTLLGYYLGMVNKEGGLLNDELVPAKQLITKFNDSMSSIVTFVEKNYDRHTFQSLLRENEDVSSLGDVEDDIADEEMIESTYRLLKEDEDIDKFIQNVNIKELSQKQFDMTMAHLEANARRVMDNPYVDQKDRARIEAFLASSEAIKNNYGVAYKTKSKAGKYVFMGILVAVAAIASYYGTQHMKPKGLLSDEIRYARKLIDSTAKSWRSVSNTFKLQWRLATDKEFQELVSATPRMRFFKSIPLALKIRFMETDYYGDPQYFIENPSAILVASILDDGERNLVESEKVNTHISDDDGSIARKAAYANGGMAFIGILSSYVAAATGKISTDTRDTITAFSLGFLALAWVLALSKTIFRTMTFVKLYAVYPTLDFIDNTTNSAKGADRLMKVYDTANRTATRQITPLEIWFKNLMKKKETDSSARKEQATRINNGGSSLL